MKASSVLLPLICPHCGGALPALQQDSVLFCSPCSRFLETVGQRFVPRPGAIAAALDASRRPALHLPLWEFEVTIDCAWPDPTRKAEASLIPPIDRVYVTAFSAHNPAYFGDLGVIFTEKRVQLRPAEAPPRLAGCVRGLEAAAAFVEPHVLTILDRRVDVTGLRLTCIMKEARIWGVPFFETGQTLEDGVTGFRLPPVAIDDLTALRALRRR
jgi:hypothetical protein